MYRNVAEALVAEGHDVTYLTRRQWERVQKPDLPGIRSSPSVRASGSFVNGEVREDALSTAMCLVLPSRREGYGRMVIEASAGGVPVVVVVACPDNDAMVLVEEGRNGTIAPSASPGDLADALVAVHHRVPAVGAAPSDSFVRIAACLSPPRSVGVVLEAYGGRG